MANRKADRPRRQTLFPSDTKDLSANETEKVRLIQPVLSCAVLENSVSHFSGYGENPVAWWDTFYRYSTLKGWTDKVTALSLPLFLRTASTAEICISMYTRLA